MDSIQFLKEYLRQEATIDLYSKTKDDAQRDLIIAQITPKHDAWAVIRRAILLCDDNIERAADAQRRILSVINALSDPAESKLIKLHYVQGLTLERVADYMHYSTRHIDRLHKRALQHLSECLNEAQIFDLSNVLDDD